MESFKIAYIIHTLGFAGAEKHLLLLLPEIKRRGVECHLIIVTKRTHLKSLKSFFDQLDSSKVEYSVYYRTSRLSFFMIAKEISHVLKRNGIRMLHSHLFNGDVIAVMVKKLFYRTVILISTKHGYRENDQYRYALNKKIKKDAYYFITRYLNRKIDHSISVSHVFSDFYYQFRLSRYRLPVIHHGVAVPDVETKPTSPKTPNIILVGRLVEIKGHIFLIRAFPEILKKFPDARLVFLGDGPLRQQLTDTATQLGVISQIDFLGFRDPFDHILESQIVVAPSLFEAFGFTYLEAFAARVALVAFDCGAAREIIKNGETGFLVPVADTNALAERIIFLLHNPDERNRLAENAYRDLCMSYSAEKMGTETYSFYRQILNG